MSEKKIGEEWVYIHRNELKKLRDQEKKAEEYLGLLNRLKTEFAEYQDRARRDKENVKKFALEGFLKELLPLLDTLDSTMASFSDPKIKQGIEMIKKEFLKQLFSHGVKEVETIGKKFDPKLHEAIAVVDDAKNPPDTIIEEIAKGYVYNDKILRPATVKVVRKSQLS